MSDDTTRVRRMRTLAAQVKGCTACEGMNIPAVTQAGPGYGSVHSPVAIVGQSLCGPCMASQIPFTGGSGRFLDRSLAVAGLAKEDIFISNVVHCHPPGNRPSQPHEIANCRPYLHRELAIVAPRLVIGLGRDAGAALEVAYPDARVLPWPFRRPRTTPALDEPTAVLFAPHPSWIARQPQTEQKRYVTSLGKALQWRFSTAADPHL
jgi:DNA polymerase